MNREEARKIAAEMYDFMGWLNHPDDSYPIQAIPYTAVLQVLAAHVKED